MNKSTENDQSKPQMSLLPPGSIDLVSRVPAFGTQKYGPWNWRKCDDLSRYYSAALRHVFARLNGEDKDPNSGLPHLAHAACCLLFLIELEGDLNE